MSIIVTGGAGFIGSNFINDWLKKSEEPIINIDKLTYSGNLNNFIDPPDNKKHLFFKGDIQDKGLVTKLLKDYHPRAIINFAAESHVDRSIYEPDIFLRTNIFGTFNLLDCCKKYWGELDKTLKKNFRFLHVSTDEVYGSLNANALAFKETHPYEPNSPYSASKASSDHLVRAYNKTFGLPVLTTNCSNNYGPYQFPEKLIPLIIHNALEFKTLPIYGNGLQIRDWLYVSDHCKAIRAVLEQGKSGEVYNIGGFNEKTNIEVVHTICNLLDQLRPIKENYGIKSYQELIAYIEDRPGHDQRYAIDASKIKKDLNWEPEETFQTGIHKTTEWYLNNFEWVKQVTSGSYKQWIERQYA